MQDKNDQITAQISLYPFDSGDILKSIYAFVDIFREAGLKCEVNAMSTLIHGRREVFFSSLEKAYRKANSEGRFAMVVTLSNAAPDPF